MLFFINQKSSSITDNDKFSLSKVVSYFHQ